MADNRNKNPDLSQPDPEMLKRMGMLKRLELYEEMEEVENLEVLQLQKRIEKKEKR